MLQNIRDKATGWVAYTIVGLITIPFLFWGIQSYLGARGSLNVATVNGEEIPVQTFQRALQQQQRRLREMFGGKVPAGLIEGDEIKQSVLGNLVKTELMRQVTREGGWRVSDIAVAQEIKSSPQFQVNGKFSAKRYEQLLSSQRISKPGYESMIRQQMQLDQLREAVTASGFLTQKDRRRFIELKGQKRKIEYLVLDKNKFSGEVLVSDDEINTYYKENGSQFMTPDKVKLQYIELDREKLAKSVPVDDETLKKIYEQEKQQYRTPETRRARHILFKIKPGATDEEKNKITEKAESVYQELKSGADFGALATKYSEDKLSKEKGGDLGMLSRGDMPKSFEDKLFLLDVNAFSKPTKTSQGLEIIKVDAVEGGKQKAFEEVKAQIAADYRNREVETRFSDLTDQLVTLTYENPEALDPAAEELGLKIQDTDWITRNQGKGIAGDPKVLKAAFSEDVLDKKQNSELIELDNGNVLVIRVADYQKAAPRPLAEVKDQIAQLLKRRKLSEKLRKVGTAKLAMLKKGTALTSLVTDLGGEVKTAVVARTTKDLKPEILRAVFKMAEPGKGQLNYKGVALSDGGYALVGLKAVENPKVADDELMNNPAIEQLLGEYNQRYYDALYQTLESRQDIEVFTEQLK